MCLNVSYIGLGTHHRFEGSTVAGKYPMCSHVFGGNFGAKVKRLCRIQSQPLVVKASHPSSISESSFSIYIYICIHQSLHTIPNQ